MVARHRRDGRANPANEAALSAIVGPFDCPELGPGHYGDEDGGLQFLCPYGQPGDRLWVKETHRPIWGQTPGYLINVDYRADPQEKWERMRDHLGAPKWTPSIHMRREYSRILLEIVSVRVERLQDIGEDDARAEGAWPNEQIVKEVADYFKRDTLSVHPSLAFRMLWERINGAGSWDAPSWVWVVEFKRVTP